MAFSIKIPSSIVVTDVKDKKAIVNFNGGALSSDAGILLLREVEQQIGLVHTLVKAITDRRDSRYIKHELEELYLQRIFQIKETNFLKKNKNLIGNIIGKYFATISKSF